MTPMTRLCYPWESEGTDMMTQNKEELCSQVCYTMNPSIVEFHYPDCAHQVLKVYSGSKC